MNWWYLKEGEFWIASLKCCDRPTNFKRYFRVCKWLFSYFFLWWVGLWIPHESFSVFLYIPWPGFPSICSILTLPQWLALSVLHHVSLVYLCSLLIGLRQAQFFWPLVPCPGFSFPREWTNLWINAFAVSPFCSTLDTYILANLADTTEISAVLLLASQLPRCINNPATCLHQYTPMYHSLTVQSHPWTVFQLADVRTVAF